MQLVETATFWLTVILYALAFVLSVVAVVYDREGLLEKSIYAAVAGFTAQSTSLILRWLQTGHPPLLEFLESVSASVWFGVLIFLGIQALRPVVRSGGLFVMPVSLLLLGWAGAPVHSGNALSPSLQSAWLFVHASFATAGVGCFIVAAGMSMIWLWRNRPSLRRELEVPGIGMLDEMVFRMVLTGFLFYTIMILSGAIWANQAWGRYWGWDPIETWSLLTWLVYALYIHLHVIHRSLRGRVLVWYAVGAVVLAAFSLWGVGFVYQTIHTYG